jgi:hypothetical protein
VISGDAEDNELKRVSFGRIDGMEQVLGGIDLVQPRIVRRELHLPSQFRDLVDPIPSHKLHCLPDHDG